MVRRINIALASLVVLFLGCNGDDTVLATDSATTHESSSDGTGTDSVSSTSLNPSTGTTTGETTTTTDPTTSGTSTGSGSTGSTSTDSTGETDTETTGEPYMCLDPQVMLHYPGPCTDCIQTVAECCSLFQACVYQDDPDYQKECQTMLACIAVSGWDRCKWGHEGELGWDAFRIPLLACLADHQPECLDVCGVPQPDGTN